MNQYQGITSKGVMGMFYKALQTDLGTSWIPGCSMKFDSTQDIETYPWLGQVPAMREWIGGRNAKGFSENSISIKNKKYESTLEVNVDDLRRDKTGQLQVRIAEQARRANAHWASLLSTLILAGPSTVCYDGDYFFDTDHEEGDSGEQSNLLTLDISTLGVSTTGTATNPGTEEMQKAIVKGAEAIIGFKDDQGEPMNEDAKSFLVMVPISLWMPAVAAMTMPNIGAMVSNVVLGSELNFTVAPNARLTWTDRFAIFRTDANVKAFIRQEEMGIKVAAKAEGSEFEFDFDKHQYGISASRNVGYGFWQQACEVIMT